MEAIVSNEPETLTEDKPHRALEAAAFNREAEAELLVTVIERRPGWRFIDLGELWRYRELLYFLVWRDIKVRYKQTVLGVAWAILQPLMTMAIFTVIFGNFVKVPSDGLP